MSFLVYPYSTKSAKIAFAPLVCGATSILEAETLFSGTTCYGDFVFEVIFEISMLSTELKNFLAGQNPKTRFCRYLVIAMRYPIFDCRFGIYANSASTWTFMTIFDVFGSMYG